MDVTRIEIADLVCDAFGPHGADKEDLISVARAQGGSAALVSCLDRLPARRYRRMQDLWNHLEEVPIE